MKKYYKLIAVINLFIVLTFVNWSIYNKEGLLNEGSLVLLELAPVDPRSIIQGDYMDLRYQLADTTDSKSVASSGYIALTLNNNKTPLTSRIITNLPEASNDEVLLRYRVKNGRLTFGSESYLFQEGKGSKFAEAKYGGLIVDKTGQSILKGLYNENYELLK